MLRLGEVPWAANRTEPVGHHLPTYAQDDDLRRLINVYQLWAHQMLPQWAFQDVLIRTEAVCVKRGMKVSWRIVSRLVHTRSA